MLYFLCCMNFVLYQCVYPCFFLYICVLRKISCLCCFSCMYVVKCKKNRKYNDVLYCCVFFSICILFVFDFYGCVNSCYIFPVSKFLLYFSSCGNSWYIFRVWDLEFFLHDGFSVMLFRGWNLMLYFSAGGISCYIFCRVKYSFVFCFFLLVEFRVIFIAHGTRFGISCYILQGFKSRVIFCNMWNALWCFLFYVLTVIFFNCFLFSCLKMSLIHSNFYTKECKFFMFLNLFAYWFFYSVI